MVIPLLVRHAKAAGIGRHRIDEQAKREQATTEWNPNPGEADGPINHTHHDLAAVKGAQEDQIAATGEIDHVTRGGDQAYSGQRDHRSEEHTSELQSLLR